MLENEAKLLLNNIRAMAESDSIKVPSKALAMGARVLMENLPVSEMVSAFNDGQRDKKRLPETAAAAKTREAAITFLRLIDLELNPVNPTFDFEHLSAIHARLFEGLTPNAGKIRVNNVKLKGSEFLSSRMISTSVLSILNMIRRENFADISRNDLSMRISYYLRELFIIHPFSEGNGRCLRVFFRQLADRMSFRLNYSKVSALALRAAEIHAFQTDDIQPLYLLINKCLSSM